MPELPTLYQDGQSCAKCHEWRPAEEFYKNLRYKSGLSSYCKPCMNEYSRDHDHANPAKRASHRRKCMLKRNYGLTPEAYEALAEAQGQVCAICQKHCVSGRRLAVDHSHETGKVRGLLCGNCNQAIGKFKDDMNLLKAAIEYLEAHNGA